MGNKNYALDYRTGRIACCEYCRRQLTKPDEQCDTSLTTDHIRALSRGGRGKVLSCRKCNWLKSDLPFLDWRWVMETFPRWWKVFQTPHQVKLAVQQEHIRRSRERGAAKMRAAGQ